MKFRKEAMKITGGKKGSKAGVSGIVVGYAAPYAIYVHENLEAHHPNGEAKYLTNAILAIQVEALNKMQASLKKGNAFGKALYNYGQAIQYESQRRVPVATGFLKGTAFTRLERT